MIPVVAVVGREHDHVVVGGDRLRLAAGDGVVAPPGLDHGHVGVVVVHHGTAALEPLHDRVGGRLAVVIHVGLVCQSEDQHPRPPHGLPGVVERLHDPADHVVRHRRVDLARQFDEPRAHAVLERLPRQVEGIDGDAVTSEARPGKEGHVAEGLGGGGADHLPDVDAHRRVDHLELVDERDVDRAKDVLEQLGGLGGSAARHRHHFANHPRIDRGGTLQAGGREPADHLGDLGELALGVARILALRREGEREVLARHEPASLLQDRPHHVFGGARIRRRFKHNQLPGLEMRGDRRCRRLNEGQVRNPVGGQGCGHADQDGRHLAEPGEVGGGVEAPRLPCGLDIRRGHVLDVRLATGQLFDFGRIDVHAQGDHAVPGKRQTQRQADVAQANDADGSGLVAERHGGSHGLDLTDEAAGGAIGLFTRVISCRGYPRDSCGTSSPPQSGGQWRTATPP